MVLIWVIRGLTMTLKYGIFMMTIEDVKTNEVRRLKLLAKACMMRKVMTSKHCGIKR